MWSGAALPGASLQSAIRAGASADEVRCLAEDLFLSLPGVSRLSREGGVDHYRSAQSGVFTVKVTVVDGRLSLTVDGLRLPDEDWTSAGDLQVAEWVCIGALTSGVHLDHQGSIRIPIPQISAIYLYSRMDAIAREIGLGSDRIVRFTPQVSPLAATVAAAGAAAGSRA